MCPKTRICRGLERVRAEPASFLPVFLFRRRSHDQSHLLHSGVFLGRELPNRIIAEQKAPQVARSRILRGELLHRVWEERGGLVDAGIPRRKRSGWREEEGVVVLGVSGRLVVLMLAGKGVKDLLIIILYFIRDRKKPGRLGGKAFFKLV